MLVAVAALVLLVAHLRNIDRGGAEFTELRFWIENIFLGALCASVVQPPSRRRAFEPDHDAAAP